MTIPAGTRLGAFEVSSLLGVGGMGEVYRARDTHLGRAVAIKVLPESFANDAERLARFEREAKLLASLNHPGIAALHGLEEADGIRFLVMELVEGETVAARLAHGRVRVEEALELARQIAEALEAAHENGVIHRDVKPSNAKITPEGRVKVLDFGLAKAFREDAPESDSSFSPTLSRDATRAGVILGTAAYMSPEQARGKRVDKRSDIFSFGALVYEILSGRRAFPGEDVSDVLASVIKIEPDWSVLPSSLHPRIRELLQGCLEKDPRERRRDIGDVRIEIQRVLAEPGRGKLEAKAAPTPTVGRARIWRVVAAASVGALSAGAFVWSLRPPPAPEPVTRFAVMLPREDRLTGTGRHVVALSPDGQRLVYSANEQLYLREMDHWEATPLPGTEGARNPFFSPDGEWVGFWAEGKLKKVSVIGGTPLILCEAENPYGASWTPDGSIVFGQGPGIFRVFGNGGAPQALVKVDSAGGETAQGPQMLPDGKTLLFALRVGGNWDEAQIVAQSLETGERRVLIEGGGADARYVPTGHLVYAVAASVLAVPFDLERLETRGGPVPIIEGVSRSTTTETGAAQFSFSESGSLVYVPSSVESQKLVWVDRKGTLEPLPAPERAYESPRLSPDGQRLAVVIPPDIWIYDIPRGTSSRLTFEGVNDRPRWTPDGKRVVFSSSAGGGVVSLFWKSADGSGEAEQLTKATATHHADSLSADGRLLAFHEHHSANQGDIWILPLDEKREPRAFLHTPFHEATSAFSPDGLWLAYVSNESGRNEIYVQPFPGPGGKIPISTRGGGEPIWSRDGREIFYLGSEGMMAVEIASGRGFTAGNPRFLFKEPTLKPIRGGFSLTYDVSPDGKRFITTESSGAASARLHIVLNWHQELKAKVPSGGERPTFEGR